LVGPSCAGKTTTAKFIEDKTNITHFEASEFVKSRFEDSSFDEPIIEFVKREFKEEGYDTFGQRICEEIQRMDSENVVISGFRTKEEVEYFESKFEDVFVVGIYANSLLRYQRKLERDNPDPEYAYRDFVKKDLIEYNFGILNVLEVQAEKLIINESTFDELYSKIETEVLDELNATV
jgi:dephospho-CoA kinase